MRRRLLAIGAAWIIVPWTVQIVLDRRRRGRERPAEGADDAD